MEISPYKPLELDQLVTVWEASVRATHDFLTESDIDALRPLVRDELPKVPQLVVLRDDTGSLRGFIGGSGRTVHTLFLDPGLHGQGWGRRLLEFAMAQWDANELDVNEQNPNAVGFYRHLGFEVVGRSEHDDSGRPFPILHMRLPA